MKSATILALAFLGATATHAGPAAAPPIEGLWQNRNGTLDVRIGPCGGKYCGVVVGARGNAIADARSAGLTRLVGTRVLSDYAPARDGTWRGSVFVPQLRGPLDSSIRFVDGDTIQLQGCALGGLVCKTKVWHRISAS